MLEGGDENILIDKDDWEVEQRQRGKGSRKWPVRPGSILIGPSQGPRSLFVDLPYLDRVHLDSTFQSNTTVQCVWRNHSKSFPSLVHVSETGPRLPWLTLVCPSLLSKSLPSVVERNSPVLCLGSRVGFEKGIYVGLVPNMSKWTSLRKGSGPTYNEVESL